MSTSTTPDPEPQVPEAPAQEPFVYPTIGTEKVMEKDNQPAGYETKDIKPGQDGAPR